MSKCHNCEFVNNCKYSILEGEILCDDYVKASIFRRILRYFKKIATLIKEAIEC